MVVGEGIGEKHADGASTNDEDGSGELFDGIFGMGIAIECDERASMVLLGKGKDGRIWIADGSHYEQKSGTISIQ